MSDERGIGRWDAVLNLACVLALGVLTYAAVRENGLIGRAWASWTAARKEASVLAEEWPGVQGAGGRLDLEVGPAQVVEFSDYQCPYCRQEHFLLRTVIDSLPGLRIAYRHAPGERHPAAWGAARAAICAETMGRFREMHALLFETMEWQNDTNWVKLARLAGIRDSSGFASCLRSPATQNRLETDRDLAKRLGFTATPGFVGPQGRYTGLASREVLMRLAGME